MFWALILLATCALAPAIILPEWRQYQSLQLAEQIERYRVNQVRAEVERDKRLLEAMSTDPAVIARLAQRDLSFRRLNENAVPVAVGPTSDSNAATFIPEPVRLPAALERAMSFLPALDYDAVFLEEKTRRIILVMSTMLIVLAMGLYCRSFPSHGKPET